MNKPNVLVEITAWFKMCSEDESLNFLMKSHNTINKENTNTLIDQNTECSHLNISGEWISIQSFLKIKKNDLSSKTFRKYWKMPIKKFF